MAANGHKTDAPDSITYSSVLSRDSVRIYFLIASFNDLNICACNISKTYINMKCRGKPWKAAGTKFVPSDRVSVMIIDRALYGIKYSVAAWRAKLVKTLNYMEY